VRIATIGDLAQNGAKFSLTDRQVPIRVSLVEAARSDLTAIENLPVPTAGGGAVPLKAVADISFGQGPSTVRRYNQSRRVAIGADRVGIEPSVAMERIMALPVLQHLPQGVRLIEKGDAEMMNELFANFVLAIAAGVAAGARLAGWRTAATLGEPIVWSLHAGYGMLALGLVAWGLAGLGIGSEVGALHILGIGAVGGMTLAVMSRASIGHSGRALHAPGPVALAYGLIPAAVALRWAASTWPGTLYYVGTLGAGLLWSFAFTLYLIALWPIWTSPRAGREAGA